MKNNKQSANILYLLLLAASLLTTWKAIGFAADQAFSGKQTVLWVSLAAFTVSIGLVVIAIYIKTKYGK